MSMAGRYEYSTGKFGSSPLSLLDYEVSAMLQLIPQLHGICRVFFCVLRDVLPRVALYWPRIIQLSP